MGKAVIVSGGDGGFYSIRRVYDTDIRDKLIAETQKAIDEAAGDIAKLESDLSALEAKADDLKAQNATLIDEYAAETQTEIPDLLPFQERLEKAQLAAYDLTQKMQPVRSELAEARARKLSAQKKLDAIEGANPSSEVAWCADRTVDLSPGTEVATLELPGEPQSVVIAPAGRDHEASDGVLMPTEWMTPAQAFFNTAILPGVQRWQPFFRTGYIRSVDYEEKACTLELEDERSNWQNLPVNDRRLHSNVPIEYMDCKNMPFKSGDLVVVEMSGPTDPVRVVGFTDYPRACRPDPIPGVSGFIAAVIARVTRNPAGSDLDADCSGGTDVDPDNDNYTRQWVTDVHIKVQHGSSWKMGCDVDPRETFSLVSFPFRFSEYETTENYGYIEKPGSRPVRGEDAGLVSRDPDEPKEWRGFYCSELYIYPERATSIEIGQEYRPGSGNYCFNYTSGSSRAWLKGDLEFLLSKTFTLNSVGDIVIEGNETGEQFTFKPIYLQGKVGGSQTVNVYCFFKRET